MLWKGWKFAGVLFVRNQCLKFCMLRCFSLCVWRWRCPRTRSLTWWLTMVALSAILTLSSRWGGDCVWDNSRVEAVRIGYWSTIMNLESEPFRWNSYFLIIFYGKLTKPLCQLSPFVISKELEIEFRVQDHHKSCSVEQSIRAIFGTKRFHRLSDVIMRTIVRL